MFTQTQQKTAATVFEELRLVIVIKNTSLFKQQKVVHF